MKNSIIFTICMVGAYFPSTMNAQQKDSVVTLPTVTVTSVSKVDEKVSKAFRRSFPKSKNTRWYKMNRDYLAKFIRDDMKHQALFQKNGFIKYDISYGMAHNLPVTVGEQILSVYKGYAITQVAKVTRYDQEFWIINMEGISDFIVLRVENGDLEEVSHYEKWES
jgi:hypothetical protein